MRPEDYEEWRQHPVTLEVFRALEQEARSIMEDLGNGSVLLMDSPHETALSYARKVGEIDGIRRVLEMDYQED